MKTNRNGTPLSNDGYVLCTGCRTEGITTELRRISRDTSPDWAKCDRHDPLSAEKRAKAEEREQKKQAFFASKKK